MDPIEHDYRFKRLFERSIDAIVVVDDEGRYLLANEAASALLGYPLAQLLTMRVQDISTVHPPTAAEIFEKYLQTHPDFGRFHFRRPDGQERIAEYTAVNIAPGEHIGIMRDVTARTGSSDFATPGTYR